VSMAKCSPLVFACCRWCVRIRESGFRADSDGGTAAAEGPFP
jgi:hypothetical protein